MAITQNHLPSAGGSLLHPHLQVQADRTPANSQRFLQGRARRVSPSIQRTSFLRLPCNLRDNQEAAHQRCHRLLAMAGRFCSRGLF